MTDRTLPLLPTPSVVNTRLPFDQAMAQAGFSSKQMSAYALTALAPLEAENAVLRARNRALELSADPDALTVAYMQGAEHANDRIRELRARVAELETLRRVGAQMANDLGNRRDAGPIGGASVLTDGLAGKT